MYASQAKSERVYQRSNNGIHSFRNWGSLGLLQWVLCAMNAQKNEQIKVKSRQDWSEFPSKESRQKFD